MRSVGISDTGMKGAKGAKGRSMNNKWNVLTNRVLELKRKKRGLLGMWNGKGKGRGVEEWMGKGRE